MKSEVRAASFLERTPGSGEVHQSLTGSSDTPAPPPPTAAPIGFRRTAARETGTFLLLVMAMALSLALALPHAEIVVVLTMPTPLVAVLLITFLLTPRGQRRALWSSLRVRRLGLRSWPVAFAAGAVLILVIPYGVAVLLGSASLEPVSSAPDVWLDGLLNVVITLAFITMMALTEEIGWRGYLLPRVQSLISRRKAALTVGFIHGLFHMPLMLLTTTYNSGGNRWAVATSFMVLLTAAGVFYAWLVARSGSVWPAAFAHSTVNTLLDGAGLIVVVSPLALSYIAGETGVVTMACVVGAAVILLVRGNCWSPQEPATDPADGHVPSSTGTRVP
jgi:uncharacterized protein